MKNNMTEKIQRIWGKSLKNLKNLMQFFAETDKTDKTDKAIFATFATFAIQIFKRPAVVSLRAVPVESTVKVAQRSRIPSYCVRNTSDSILSRICLVSLIWLVVGGFSVRAWGDETVTFDGTADWGNNGTQKYSPASFDKSGNHATFSLKTPLKQYNSYNGWKVSYTNHEYFYLEKDNLSQIRWTVDEGYTIKVSKIVLNASNGTDWGNRGKGYIHTSRMQQNERLKVREDGSWADVTFDVNGTNSSLYGATPTELGNSEYYILSATTAEFDIKSITLTYTIAANTYTVNYNGNATATLGGSMAQQTLTYGGTTSLNNIGFTNGYTVNFEENGGSAVADATANSNFLGWATSSGGTVAYANQASFAEALKTNNGVVLNLYAKWGSVPSITLPTPSYTGKVLEGWYEDEDFTVLAGRGGATYTPESNITLYAKWMIKETPHFYYDGETTSLMVDDEQSNNSFRFENAPNLVAHISVLSISEVNNGDGQVIEYDATNKRLIAHNAGRASIYFTQAGTDEIFEGTSDTWTFTVSKYVTSFSGSAYNLMVEGTQTADYSYTNTSAAKPTANSGDDFYYAVENVVFTNSEKNSGVNFVTFNPEDKLITACNAGTGTITLRQKETYKFTGDTVSFDVAVYKYNSVFTGVANFNNVLVDNPVTSEYVLTYTKPDAGYVGAANHVAGAPALEGAFRYAVSHDVQTENVVGSPDGSVVIAYDPSTKVATAKNKGVGTVTLTQDETYKYNGGTTSFNVNVIKRTPVYTWDGDAEEHYSFEYPYNSEVKPVFSTTSGKEVAYTAVSDSVYTANMVEDSLYVYNVAEIAHITVSQPETYKWNAHEKTYTITPVKSGLHVPFSLTNENHTVYEPEGALTTYASWNGSKQGYRYGDNNDASTETSYAIIHFEGVPGILSFDKSLERTLFDILPQTRNCAVYQSPDGTEDSWSEVWFNDVEEEYTLNNKVRLSPDTRYIKFYYEGSIHANYYNISVSEGVQFETDPATEFDFGLQGQNYGLQEEVINFFHANAGRVTTARILDGPDAEYFSVAPAEINGTGRDIVGSNTLIVSFDNKTAARAENEYYGADLYISDNAGNETTLHLKGRRHGKSYPKFTFNPNHVPYYYGNTIHNIVVSTNNDTTITVTSSDNSIAEIVDGKLEIKNRNAEVTITVSQPEKGDFRAHTQTFKFTPREEPPLKLPFIMTKTIYDNNKMVISKGADVSWTDDGYIRSGWSDWQATASGRYFDSKKVFVIEFSGTPDKLSFTAKNTYSSIKCRWKVEQSSDSVNWSQVFYKNQSCKDDVTFSDIQLDPSTRYLRFQYGGNYTGYFKDIHVSCIDGVKYMLTSDGKYLSRGGAWGTRAIVDEFGVPVKVTRSTRDNTNYTTQVMFMDSRQYLYETSDKLYTDNKGAGNNHINWKQIVSDGKVKVQSENGSNKYITVSDGKLNMTDDASAAIVWEVEDYTLHAERIQAKLDHKAAEAANHDFGKDINTMAKVRSMLIEEEFDYTNISLDAVPATEQKGVYRTEEGTNAVYDREVTGLEPGFYRLKVQALYKPSPSPLDWENHTNGFESVVAYAYANDFKFPIKSVYDITGRHAALVSGDTLCGGYYYPANLASATTAFTDANTYLHDLYVYVTADPGETTGTLRYGIVNPSYVPGVWMVYEDFKLEKIARKTYVFDNNEGTGSSVWGTEANWEYQGGRAVVTPNEKNSVVIEHDVEVAGEFKVFSLEVKEDVTVTIDPTSGLTIGAGGVSGPGKIVLKAATSGEDKGKTGYIRISPDYEGEMPEATIELLRQGYTNGSVTSGSFSMRGTSTWQYIGIPVVKEGKLVKRVVGGWINSWDETAGAWVNTKGTLLATPFVGFANSQSDNIEGALNPFKGQLIDNGTFEIPLTYTEESAMSGWNLLANSFAAPIDIEAMFNDNSEDDVEQTVYLFNAGNTSEVDGVSGTYTVVTKALAGTTIAEEKYQGVIPAMQGFFVKAKRDCNFTFNYTNAVWRATYEEGSENTPLRVSRRGGNRGKQVLSISMEANGQRDKVLLIEQEDYSTEFENGYDAHYMPVGGFNIFAVEDDDHLAIDATNSIIGTRVGVRTGEETAYTMTFSHVNSDDDLTLWDIEAEEKIEISEGQTYTFFAEPNSEITNRFIIIEREAPELTTGVEPTSDSSLKGRATKFVKDDKLFILKNGVLYDATGKRVQ